MDDLAAAYDPNISEPVAEEPLERVGTEKELNAEKQVDKDYVHQTTYEPVKDHANKSAQTESRPGFSRSATNATTATSASGFSVASRETPNAADTMKPKHKWYNRLLLKSGKLPPVPKERTVSPEYGASFFSQYTFQWMQPIMTKGYQRPLELNDIWLVNPDRSAEVMSRKLMASFKKRVERKDKKPLLGAMYETFKFEFILSGACQLTSSVLQVITPFILRYLITFSQEAYYARFDGAPAPSIGRGVGLVIAITILQTIQSGATNQSLYRGMMNGGQARAVLISLIFDKAMKLSGRARAGGNISDSNKEKPPNVKPGSEEEKKWFKKKLNKDKKKEKKGKKGPAEEEQGWGNGRIVNLMSVDTYRIDQASWGFHQMWTSPISILITLALLLVNITYSALAGFGLIIIAMPILSRTIKVLFARRKAINKITDQRVSLTQEILQAVRFVKYFGWETSFLERLGGIRQREIGAIQVLLAIRNAINAIAMSLPVFASMLAFITFSLTNHRLNPAYVFSSLALFNSLRLPLNLLPLVIGQNVDALASVTRIQDFLLAEEAKDEANIDLNAKGAVEVHGASFTWERSPVKESEKTTAERKKDLKQEKSDSKAAKKAEKLSRAENKHNEKVLPPVSSGLDSSSTLAEVVEEKPFTINNLDFSIGRNELVAVIGGVGSGKSSLLAALAGDMRRTSGEVTLGASRAFCPQYAWIQNATVKENILFGKDYNSRWYNEVIDACALRADLDMLPNGDQTEIGERGITVSGGQKQRLNIARAIYFNSDLVIMDDPLSAVDAHVGRHIMDQAICGLLRNKCRVLATHQLWVLSRCDRVIWMENGGIQAVDTFENLMANNPDFVKLVAKNAQDEKKEEEVIDEDEVEEEKKEAKKRKGKKPAAALMQVEERAVSNVSWDVYKAYLKASGSLLSLPVCLLLLILSQGANISTSLWLSWWTSNKFGLQEGTYIGVYAALGVTQAIFMFFFSIALSILGTNASKKMLHDAVYHVLRAPMSFFDTTPLGRITNRFSKDIDTMDNMLTDSIRFFLMTMGQIVSVFILIIAYFYYFAAALGPLLLLFLFSAGFYRASAREVKRHESVLRSTVFARFSEAVSGISTIRAYGLEERFSQSIRDSIDDMNSAYYLTFSNQRWLSTRLDIIGNLLVFVLGILVVTSRFSVSPSTGGLVLSYILSVVQMIQFTVRQLAEVENHMNATERVHYYGTQLDQEPPLHIGNVRETWPEKGEIVFSNVEMRYRAGLPLVLRGLDLHVKGGERIGVVGRTGAGKSSIMSTLFRLVEISGGSISIDGVNINQIGLYDLRQRMSIIPQDPTLFKGTVRSNLDPFNKYNDLDLWSALRHADLVGEDQRVEDKTGRIHLDSPVDEEGLNFSLGQRQLMALARALVRGSQIIVCDEATSSIDMDTDAKIQRTIAEGFKGKTLLCIAHRLKTIINYDRIVVMDQGQIAELDTPIALFNKRAGIFRSMCDRSSITREDFENTY